MLADAGSALSAPFRQALSARGLCCAAGIPQQQKVYPANISLIFPVAYHDRQRLSHISDSKSVAAETTLSDAT